jgi:predicted ATPase/DNA-binding SARP family transcriptional activator/Tfp pilus assembly protein PilF
MPPFWNIQLLGTLCARSDDQTFLRFSASKTGAVLACLAFNLGQSVTRESLIERLWAEEGLDRGRHNLRQSLTLLRRQFEPTDAMKGVVFTANHQYIRMSPDAVTTDVLEFRAGLSQIRNAPPEKRLELMRQVADLYHGDFLPGYFEDWILVERERLINQYIRLLRQILTQLRDQKQYEEALEYGLRAVAAAPLRDDVYVEVFELYQHLDRPKEAWDLYRRQARLFRKQLGAAPSNEVKSLLPPPPPGIPERSIQMARKKTVRPTLEAKPRKRRKGASLPQTVPFPTAKAYLPSKLTRFFGRDVELDYLMQWLKGPQEKARLVTLTGMGGAGKTRLALEIGRRLHADGINVYFAGLSDTSSASLIPDAIASALPRASSLPVPPLEQIRIVLTEHPGVLILDNMEHLIEEGAAFCARLLAELPDLTILVTSRQRLNLEGEREFVVQPLGLPGEYDSPAELLAYPSVQMFVDRVQGVCPDFQVTRKNAAYVATLCERLKGLPLAIELAASHAHVLTPSQILMELADRMGFLVGRQRIREGRHSTLRMTVDWSYQLLSARLRRFFCHLSVFRGGWTLEAAQAVCQEERALTYLEQLRERSMVHTVETNGVIRFHMLETLREFALEHLSEADRLVLERKHTTYFCKLAESAEPHLRGPEAATWLDRLDLEQENLRIALRCKSDPEEQLRMAAALFRYWYERGHFAEGCQHLQQRLNAAPEASRSLQARARFGLGMLLLRQGTYAEAREHVEQSLRLSRALEDSLRVAEALNGLGVIAMEQGDFPTARSFQEEALELWRAKNNLTGQAGTLNNLGLIASNENRLALAHEYFVEALAIYRRLDSVAQAGSVLSNLAMLAYRQQNYEQARVYYTESLELFRKLDYPWNVAVSLHNLGETYAAMKQPQKALPLLRESLTVRQSLGDRAGVALTLDALAGMALVYEDQVGAARLLEGAEVLRATVGAKILPLEREQHAANTARIRQECLPEDLEAARAWAQNVPVATLLDYAQERIAAWLAR